MENQKNLDKINEWFIESFCPEIKYEFDLHLNKEDKHNLIVSLGPPTFSDITKYIFKEFKPQSVLAVSALPKTKLSFYYTKREGLKADISLATLFKFKNVLYLIGNYLYPPPPEFLSVNEYLALYRKIWKDFASVLKKNFNIEKCIGFWSLSDIDYGLCGIPISKCKKTLKKYNLELPDYLIVKGGGEFALMQELSDLNIESFVIFTKIKMSNTPAPPGFVTPKKTEFNENPYFKASRILFKKLEEILEIDLNFPKFEEFQKGMLSERPPMIFEPEQRNKDIKNSKDYFI